MALWTDQDDHRLRLLYEAWAGDVIPVDSIARALRRSPGAVRYRAHKLGLTDPTRPRAARGRPPAPVITRTCAQCLTSFVVTRASDPKVTCSRSCAARHRARPMRGRYAGSSKAGKRADLGDIFFRSAWEANYSRYLNLLVANGEITAWEFEPQHFRFPVKRGNRAYLPDFRVWLPDGTYEWHEVKGYMDNASRIKLQRFALHYPAESARLKLIDKTAYYAIKAEWQSRLEGWE